MKSFLFAALTVLLLVCLIGSSESLDEGNADCGELSCPSKDQDPKVKWTLADTGLLATKIVESHKYLLGNLTKADDNTRIMPNKRLTKIKKSLDGNLDTIKEAKKALRNYVTDITGQLDRMIENLKYREKFLQIINVDFLKQLDLLQKC